MSENEPKEGDVGCATCGGRVRDDDENNQLVTWHEPGCQAPAGKWTAQAEGLLRVFDEATDEAECNDGGEPPDERAILAAGLLSVAKYVRGERVPAPRAGYVTARVVEVFVVCPTIDDRGSPGGIVGAYAREGGAHEAAKGIGYFGSDGTVDRRKALVSDDGQVWLLDAHNPLLVLNTGEKPARGPG